MLQNLASSLFLTEGDAELDPNAPKVKGRVVTTLHKAKEVRPLVEKCITIARHSLTARQEADQFKTDAERGSESWKAWRTSDEWQKWNQAVAPTVAARRHARKLLRNKKAVQILFDEIAPRMADRNGGYTRILRLATPRLGDGGTRVILELVGVHDRVRVKGPKPEIEGTSPEAETAADDAETQQEEGELEETVRGAPEADVAPEESSDEPQPPGRKRRKRKSSAEASAPQRGA